MTLSRAATASTLLQGGLSQARSHLAGICLAGMLGANLLLSLSPHHETQAFALLQLQAYFYPVYIKVEPPGILATDIL